MNLIRLSSAALVCGALVACGGNKNVAPATEPSPAPAPVPEVKEAPVSLDSAVDRYSYALGLDLGRAIANVNVPLKMDVVMLAIKDAADPKREPLMSDSASENALQDLLLLMKKKKEADEAAAAKKAILDQAQFLSKNITDSTVMTTPKGVQYKILKEGTGIVPKAADKVKVHYIGALLDGTEFDNSVKRGEPLEFPVSAVIEGWQDLLQVMKEGEKVKAWIPSALAYGEEGVPPMIPANALLVFEVELLKVYAENPVVDSALVAPVDSSAEKPAAEAPSEKKADEVKADAPEASDINAAKPEAAESKQAPKADAKKDEKKASKK